MGRRDHCDCDDYDRRVQNGFERGDRQSEGWKRADQERDYRSCHFACFRIDFADGQSPAFESDASKTSDVEAGDIFGGRAEL